MKKITTLEEALKRIDKLENENAELKEANADLKEELEYFKKRKACGRDKIHSTRRLYHFCPQKDGHGQYNLQPRISSRIKGAL